jgi:Ser/Thr protein kinase RdoA (MazF antagonist)
MSRRSVQDQADLDRAAGAAAERWADDVASVDLLAISENAVYRVETDSGDRFVLRLHRPGYNTIAEMASEQRWVESLRDGGVAVPRPRRSLDGDRYESVAVTPGAGDGASRWAGAIDWVDGVKLADLIEAKPVEEQRDAVPELYRSVGELAARIRTSARAWRQPDGFTRRAWDADGLLGPEPLWGRFWDLPSLSSSHAALLGTTRDHLYELLKSLPTDDGTYGLIHADLHQSNVLFNTSRDSTADERAVAIDFDDAGFGWYIHELAVALQAVVDEPWVATAKAALVDGYHAVHPLSDDELSLLDAFCTIRTLMIIGWLDARPELDAHAQLGDYIDWACGEAETYLETAHE